MREESVILNSYRSLSDSAQRRNCIEVAAGFMQNVIPNERSDQESSSILRFLVSCPASSFCRNDKRFLIIFIGTGTCYYLARSFEMIKEYVIPNERSEEESPYILRIFSRLSMTGSCSYLVLSKWKWWSFSSSRLEIGIISIWQRWSDDGISVRSDSLWVRTLSAQ